MSLIKNTKSVWQTEPLYHLSLSPGPQTGILKWSRSGHHILTVFINVGVTSFLMRSVGVEQLAGSGRAMSQSVGGEGHTVLGSVWTVWIITRYHATCPTTAPAPASITQISSRCWPNIIRHKRLISLPPAISSPIPSLLPAHLQLGVSTRNYWVALTSPIE